MKTFDFAIGNPPYQMPPHKNNSLMRAVFHVFMDAAYELAETAILITPGKFLFEAGSTPKAWNRKMLKDNHFKVIRFMDREQAVFGEVEIHGGILISIRRKQKTYEPVGEFIPYELLQRITNKVTSDPDFISLVSIIYQPTKFDLNVLYKDYPAIKERLGAFLAKEPRLTTSTFLKMPELYTTAPDQEHDIEILGRINGKRETRFVNSKYLFVEKNLYKYKVVIPKANGSGEIGEPFVKPTILEPAQGYTQSFYGIGAFDTRQEAENCLEYLKTKFLRTVFFAGKGPLKDNPPRTWKFVPLIDFSNESNYNFSSSLDEQLYNKYHLDKEEREYIDTKIEDIK